MLIAVAQVERLGTRLYSNESTLPQILGKKNSNTKHDQRNKQKPQKIQNIEKNMKTLPPKIHKNAREER